MAIKNNRVEQEGSSTYDYIAYVSIAVILIAAFYIGFELTGNVTDTAQININISDSTNINFTIDTFYFGNGTVTLNTANATLYSDNCTVVGGTWASCSPKNFTLENIGNSNVSLTLAFGKDADGFIGGSNPGYSFKYNNAEAGSCVNNSNTGVWYTANTTAVNLCSKFYANDTIDTINISVKLVVPNDALGVKSDVITATATAV